MEPLLLSFADVARQLQVSVGTVKRLTNDGTLPTLRVGRFVRVPAISVQMWVDTQLQRGQSPRKIEDLFYQYDTFSGRAKRSTERNRYSAKALLSFFSGRDVDDIGKDAIRGYFAFRQAKGILTSTIKRELGFLGAALNWAKDELGWPIVNPLAGRRWGPVQPRTRWLSREEAEALLLAASSSKKAPYLAVFIKLALNTGMRSGELLNLCWDRVDFENRLIYLNAADQKNGKVNSVPLNATAIEMLSQQRELNQQSCPESPWVFCDVRGRRIASIKRSFATAVRRAKLSDVRPHDLRRTCGSWLVQDGVEIKVVAEILRHQDINVTHTTYAHLAPKQLLVAIETLDRHD